MKRITLFILMAAASVFFAACGAPATNNVNSNANTTRPTAAAPTADALLALDKQANEAYIKGDSKFFEGFLVGFAKVLHMCSSNCSGLNGPVPSSIPSLKFSG